MNRCLHILWHVGFGLAFIAGFGVIVMSLWNWLLPAIFGIAVINFWQALGLLVLCRILFGSFGAGKMFVAGDTFHRKSIRAKWQQMMPEERKEFLRRHHFGHGHGFGHDFFTHEESEKKDEEKA
jgi:hypothetical protein